MPTYTVKSPAGQSVKITGDAPPTEKELDDIFAKIAPADTRAPVAANPNVPAKALPQQEAPDFFHSDHAIGMPGQLFGNINVNPAGALNAVKDLGVEGGGIALGQAAGAPFAEFGGVQAGGAVGGFLGSVASQLTNFADPNSHFSLGRAVANAGVGAIPGSFLAKPGVSLAKKALAMGAANVGAANVQSLVDEGQPASLTQDAVAVGAGALAPVLGKVLNSGSNAAETAANASRDSVRRATLNEGRALGLGVPPAVIRPSGLNNTVQSIGGKAAVAQEQILRNQPKVNAAIRAEIGLPAAAPLSPIALNTAKIAPNLVYDEVSKMTPASAGLLDNFKTATAEAKLARANYQASIDAGRRNIALLQEAQAQDAIADQMSTGLKNEAKQAGKSDLMDRFESARLKLAQIGLTERAVNLGSGDVDPRIIGQALEHGEKLSGAFKTVGKFENAFGKYLKDAATTPPSGVDYLKMLGKFGIGTGIGYAAGGYPGAVLGGVGAQMAEKGARNLAVNPSYQRAFGSPNYGSRLPDFKSQLASFGTASAGRKKN